MKVYISFYNNNIFNYLIILHCKIESRFQVKRDALKTILLEFEKNNIRVPYNQIDVHNK